MARVNQGIQDIKHLILLRKALMAKRSLEIYSQNPSMRLTIGEGLFHGGNCVETICTMIEHPLPVFDCEALERKALFIAQNPKQIFSQAIARMKLNQDRLNDYLRSFARLPRVRMQQSSLFHGDKVMQEEYQALYRLSLAENGASVTDYLKSAAGLEQLKRRTGIVIASYCLGDFIIAESFDSKAGKQTIVSRILSRLRRQSDSVRSVS